MNTVNRHRQNAQIRNGSSRYVVTSVHGMWPAGACLCVDIDMIKHNAGFKTTS